MLGDKTSQQDFLSVLEKALIFCLQETKQTINIPNYICYNSNLKKSRSGGVCLGVHRTLEKDITLITTEDPDIVGTRRS